MDNAPSSGDTPPGPLEGAPAPRVLVAFWSWQSDSDAKTNRSFIEDCISRAGKAISDDALILAVDRGTEGVGGTPDIAETILSKISTADVFLWDATIIVKRPRPAPNPNVLFELGYAVAALGWERIVGVMNISDCQPGDLPFDLRHRRWPIQFELASPPRKLPFFHHINTRRYEKWIELRQAQRKTLVATLTEALKLAIKGPRGGIAIDTDQEVARALWRTINSRWLQDWLEYRKGSIQWEHREGSLDVLEKYRRTTKEANRQFTDPQLSTVHEGFLAALRSYLGAVGTEMSPVQNSRDTFVLNAKTVDDWIDDYDQRYDAGVKIMEEGLKGIEGAWAAYAGEVGRRFGFVYEPMEAEA